MTVPTASIRIPFVIALLATLGAMTAVVALPRDPPGPALRARSHAAEREALVKQLRWNHLMRLAGQLDAGQKAREARERARVQDATPRAVASQDARRGGSTFAAAFDAELQRAGALSAGAFEAQHRAAQPNQDRLGWDPTTARFYDLFAKDPRTIPPDRSGRRHGRSDFRLDAAELAAFRRQGLVASERLGGESFGEVFYRIYSRDLPVLVTTDAILHAWHRSFDALLEELEETLLLETLEQLLAGSAGALPAAVAARPAPAWSEGLTDADLFLAVGLSLLQGKPQPCRLGGGCDAQVSRILDAVASGGVLALALFGTERTVHTSVFKPRGHYANSERLRRYFRAVTWLGTTDLRVAGGEPGDASIRQLAGAAALLDLLQRSGQLERWRLVDGLLQAFIGPSDSLTPAGLVPLLAEARRLPAPSALDHLRRRLEEQGAGAQEIRGHAYAVAPGRRAPRRLPQAFAFLGQRFAIDSWATGKLVFDEIWLGDRPVQRRMPSSVDVAYAALGNDHAAPILAARMRATDGVRFRDGLPYAPNLVAARRVIDGRPAASWDQSLYTGWLAALRELSAPTTAAPYPQAMRTRAWAMKTLGTQLASWTQLRHDTVLYVKQSFGMGVTCAYPAGYVEPRVAFWRRLERLASQAARILETTPFPDVKVARKNRWGDPVDVRLTDVKTRAVAFLKGFARTVTRLGDIADKELRQRPLDPEETRFLEDVVQIEHGSGFTRWNGWYPGLFYKGREDAGKPDALVADVHTSVPSPGDPGGVLHGAVGNVDLLILAVDSGTDRAVYAGPVLSHYELATTGSVRLSDDEWKGMLRRGTAPPRPDWTRGHVVPKARPAAASGHLPAGPR